MRIMNPVLVALLLCVLASCNQTLEDVIATYRAPVEANVKKVKALAPRVKATPRYSAAAVSPVKDLVVMRNSFGNALVIHERDLERPESFQYAPERPNFAGELFSCINQLTQKTNPNDKFAPTLGPVVDLLKTCAGIKYVLVMRTHKRNMAKMITSDGFLGGSVDGDVVAFTLAGHPLGGFAWHAKSSDMIPVAMNASPSDMQWALDAHMRDEVERAILDEIKRGFGNAAAW